MNYLLILIGYEPSYINYTINSILSVDKNANIYICSNQNINFKNTTFVNLNEVNSSYINKLQNLSIYKNTIFENNPLWITSLVRIFYLYELKKLLNLKQVVHFDNDVLIYKPFDEIENYFSTTKLNITQANDKKLIFGYSYFENDEVLKNICDLIIEKYKYGIDNNWRFNSKKPFNEMQMLGYIENNHKFLFHILPSLPYQAYNNSHKMIFDPAGYGQFLDGTDNNKKKFFQKGYFSLNDFIGAEIIAKRISIYFNKSPVVGWEGKKFKLVNLHVHSKRLHKFLPQNFKNYT